MAINAPHRSEWEEQEVEQTQREADARGYQACDAGRQAPDPGFPEDEHGGDYRPHPAQEVGRLVDKSRQGMRHYPISDEARHRHVQGVGDIPRRQLWVFHFGYDFVSHWITPQ
jgi:hypothetical protein